MATTEISSRDFASDPLKVKRLVKHATVIVTNRGEPELAIMPYKLYSTLISDLPPTALAALGNEELATIDLEIPQLKDMPKSEDY